MSSDLLERFPDAIESALTIRRAEERLLGLFGEGKIFGTLHTCIGQEFVGVAVARSLQPQDTIFSNHRGHGHFLSRHDDLVGLFGEIMGRAVGVCGGRGGSQHLHLENFYANGILGGTTPLSVGMALGHRLRGTGGIAVVFVGDGALGEGVLYESMNIASLWCLPILFVLEDNGYAQSTRQAQALAGDIDSRAEAFGISTAQSNTWDWPKLFDDMAESIDAVRTRGEPRFHRVDTYRLAGHSKGDDDRPPEEVESFRRRDPLNRIAESSADDPRWRAMLERVRGRIDAALAQADGAPLGTIEAPAEPDVPSFAWVERPFERERVVGSVRRALGEVLAERGDVILLGEDVESPYGGAFKCTQGLSERFPDRVVNTPISEAAIVGVGCGLALSGLTPVVEIMFGDFLMLAADQWINHAAKLRFLYGEGFRVPLVVRTPMGGRRGYGPTHSQSLEKHFIGLPDTQVLCLHHRYSPAQLYRALFETLDRPTLVVENKTLYAEWASSQPPDGFRLVFTDETFPTARLAPLAPADLTLVAIGGMSLESEQAALRLFEESEVVVDLFLPARLYPFDAAVLEESLTRTRRLLVVEEGQGFASLGSEILAQVAERYPATGVRCARVCAAPSPIPASRSLEERCLPGVDTIVAHALELTK